MLNNLSLEAVLKAALSCALADDDTPFALGFSGGGDSAALLYGLRAEASRAHVFIVDHGLRAGSADEALVAQKQAQDWGYRADILTWTPKPLHSGLQEKARCARYGLIGAAMRERGLRFLITGHTQDDQAETCMMRYERATDWRGAAGMAEKVYAPVWPQLAGVTVIRPLLGHSRASLRRYNESAGLKWTEDPSNENLNFARIRARHYLSAHPQQKTLLLETAKDMQIGLTAERAALRQWIGQYAQVFPQGYIRITAAPSLEGVMHLLRAVSGQGALIDRAALGSLRAQMTTQGFKAATLGGAHIVKDKGGFLIMRDPAAIKGRRGHSEALTPQDLPRGSLIWDGRFEIKYTGEAKLRAAPAYGRIGRFKDQLKDIPAPARLAVPLILSPDGAALSYGAFEGESLRVIWLGTARLMGGLTSPCFLSPR